MQKVEEKISEGCENDEHLMKTKFQNYILSMSEKTCFESVKNIFQEHVKIILKIETYT